MVWVSRFKLHSSHHAVLPTYSPVVSIAVPVLGYRIRILHMRLVKPEKGTTMRH